MANYKETSGSATTWTRANRVMILNPLEPEVGKQISFFEETVAKVGDTVIRSDSGYTSAYYVPDKQVELLDPQSGEPTGKTITHAEIYQAIYSMYITAAKARDLAIAVTSNP